MVIDWKWGPQIPDWFSWIWGPRCCGKWKELKDRQQERQQAYSAGDLGNILYNAASFTLHTNSGKNLSDKPFPHVLNKHAIYIDHPMSALCFFFQCSCQDIWFVSVSMKIGFHHWKREIWLEMEYYWFVPHECVVWCRYMSTARWLRGIYAWYIPSSVFPEFLMPLTTVVEMVWQEKLYQTWSVHIVTPHPEDILNPVKHSGAPVK